MPTPAPAHPLTVSLGGPLAAESRRCIANKGEPPPRNTSGIVVSSPAMDWGNKVYYADEPGILRECGAGIPSRVSIMMP